MFNEIIREHVKLCFSITRLDVHVYSRKSQSPS